MGRPVPAYSCCAQLSSRAPRRTRRAYSANDASSKTDRAVVSGLEPRSLARGDSLPRFRKTLGKRAARKRLRHELRRTRRISRAYFHRTGVSEFVVAKVECRKCGGMEKSCARLGRCSPASVAF